MSYRPQDWQGTAKRAYFAGYEDGTRDALANGERVEICDSHFSMWLNDDDGCEAAVGGQVKPWRNPCHKVSRLLVDIPILDEL